MKSPTLICELFFCVIKYNVVNKLLTKSVDFPKRRGDVLDKSFCTDVT